MINNNIYAMVHIVVALKKSLFYLLFTVTNDNAKYVNIYSLVSNDSPSYLFGMSQFDIYAMDMVRIVVDQVY